MFDETETIDGNPKSWAAWKREAERLQKIIDEMTTNHPAHGPVSLFTTPPAPEALKRLRSIVADPKTLPRRKEWISGQQYSYVLLESVEAMVDDACRAAMLNHTEDILEMVEPVSNSDELPLDYLQGHKDGLEWAAQLAEANHPQTGDWLYDDPIELARAIRKGPDMPTVQDGNSPVIPDGWVMVPVEPTMAMLDEFDSIIDYGAEDSKDAWSRLIAAAPQQDVKSALEHGMQRYAGAMQKLSEGDK